MSEICSNVYLLLQNINLEGYIVIQSNLASEIEFGGFVVADDRLPLVRLRERRRELVLALNAAYDLPQERIREIAEVQQAIKAVEAVIAE